MPITAEAREAQNRKASIRRSCTFAAWARAQANPKPNMSQPTRLRTATKYDQNTAEAAAAALCRRASDAVADTENASTERGGYIPR